MKILVLCEGDAETYQSWSGISISVVHHLRKLGHTVYTGDADLKGLTRWLAIASSWSPNRFRWWVRYHLTGLPFKLRTRRAQQVIRLHRDRVDVILQFGATFEPRGRGELPYVLYCDGNARLAERGETGGQAEVGALSAGELARVIQREAKIYQGASRIFTFSDRLTSSFVEDFAVPAHKVRTVNAGPNIDPEAVPVPDEAPLRDPRTILFVGRRFQRKGGDLLLAAFASVKEEFPDARLLIIGPNEPLAPPQAGVEWLGFLRKEDPDQKARLTRAYQEADVFCLPTRFEPFGVVFLEAMLHGLPCVGPNAWAVPEMIVDGETGILVEPENVQQLASALGRLMVSKNLAHQMGSAGRNRAVDHFLWDKVVARMVEGMSEVL